MKLIELIRDVRDEKLTREQLESYYDKLSELVCDMYLEAGELEKKEALYFISNKAETDVATKRNWKATPEGLRQIDIKYYIQATNKMLSSVKNRVYGKLSTG